jgi:4-hydroxybenzoate polyprenyltransferase
MTSYPGKLRSLLATARIANVPSVVVNVWAGSALAIFFTREDPAGCWWNFVLLALAGVLMYLSGNFLNDWSDRNWDALNRPERALPRQLFKPRSYLWAGGSCALTGCLLAAAVSASSGLVAATLLASISIYTRWHKRAAWAVVPMGLCRALLPLMGIFVSARAAELDATVLAIIGSHALALFLYICGLSISARGEARATASAKPPLIGRIMLGISGACAATYWLIGSPLGTALAVIPFAIWTALALTIFRKPVGRHVAALLAGIPLLDAIPLLCIASLSVSASGQHLLGSPFTTICLLLPPLAFALGRLLQRVAPAT